LRHHLFALAMLAVLPLVSNPAAADNAAVLDSLTGENAALPRLLSAPIRQAGYSVTLIGQKDLCDPGKLKEFDLLVIPDGSCLPAASIASVDAYLRSGGDLIAMKTPLWQKTLLGIGGRWITREDYESEHQSDLPRHVLFDFHQGGLVKWFRSTNAPEVQSRYTILPKGPTPGTHSLHAVIPILKSWDTIGIEKLQKPFAYGDTLTVFFAKGTRRTTQLAIEWREKDGSRWIAVAPLTNTWRRYILRPSDFKFWESVPSRKATAFNPENAVAVHIGLAYSHTSSIGPGRQEFWVGPFGTEPTTPEIEQILNSSEPPDLDTLSPGYKLFDCDDVAALRIRKEQAFEKSLTLDLPSTIRSPHPRAGGGGFDKGRDWRYIPLVEAWSPKGEWRGAPVALTVNASGPYKGSVWASFGIPDAKWYKSPGALDLIEETAARIRRGLFIVDGGSDFYTYFDNQPLTLGARIANLSRKASRLTVRITASKGDETAWSRTWPVSVPAAGETTVKDTWQPETWPQNGYQIKAELISSTRTIDRVTHDAHVWQPKAEKRFITTKDGQFILDGKRWRMHAINYMPSSGIASSDGEYFERWLGARSYDSEVVQRDLDHVKDIGFNSVSIFIYDSSIKAQNLLDILRRLDRLGLKANLSLRPGHITDFGWDKTSQIVKYYRLAENDTVFAYDLDWEPVFRQHDARTIWDADWLKWINERYGSLESAERDWGRKAPRDASGAVTNPFPDDYNAQGAVMIAAYRRFLDTLLYKKYSEWRRLVRELDPNHLVSFRMAEAGNPQIKGDWIPYDFPYLAAAVDFLSPEAYGRAGDWERVKPGWFEFEYARWAAPDKPMIWAEHGITTWDRTRMANSPSAMADAGKSYENFYRLLIGSGASGIAHWWYPGGFRCGEVSDFGIINPDGTDRPVTKVIRERGPRFLNGPSAKPVDHWITIDRDASPDGIAGAYDAVKEEFWNAIDSGQTPGLRTAGTGTDSTNCPLIAVGNVPCTGSNPPKYLDAAFDEVVVKDGRARVTITNLGEATWSASPGPDGKGAVALLANATKIPIPERVPHLGSVTFEFDLPSLSATLTMLAEGRTTFGEKYVLR
jgi:hypothetical protein